MKKKEMAKKVICMAACTASIVMGNVLPVLAKEADAGTSTSTSTSTGVPQIDTFFTVMKTLLIAIVSGIGVVKAIPQVGEFAEAFQQKDSHGMWDSGKGLLGSAIMIFVGPVLSLLGIV